MNNHIRRFTAEQLEAQLKNPAVTTMQEAENFRENMKRLREQIKAKARLRDNGTSGTIRPMADNEREIT